MSIITNGCPCLYVEPCDPMCTCVRAGSSHGCERCVLYGSPEDRASRAEHLVGIQEQLDDTVEIVHTLQDSLKQAHSLTIHVELNAAKAKIKVLVEMLEAAGVSSAMIETIMIDAEETVNDR